MDMVFLCVCMHIHSCQEGGLLGWERGGGVISLVKQGAR